MNVLTAAEEASVMKKKRCFWWFFPFDFLPFFFFLNQNHVFGKSLKSFTLFYFKIWLSGYFYSSILNLFKIILFFFIKMKTLFINWLIQLISQQSIRFLSEISDHTDETVLVIFIVCHSPRESTCSPLHIFACSGFPELPQFSDLSQYSSPKGNTVQSVIMGTRWEL